MGVLVEDLLALARLDERRDVVIAPVDLRPIARDAALDVRAASPQRPVTVIDTTIAEIARPRRSRASPNRRRAAAAAAARRRSRPAISRAGRDALAAAPPTPARSGLAGDGAGELRRCRPSTSAASRMPRPLTPPIVLGDENRIRQVVANLLGNARRFTTEDSPIELRVGVDAGARTGWIEVVDHGEGIPDQIKEKIFQRFWRADTSRARETGGTGLGLSIVASIVDALHGSVEVVDTPGGGATFRVALPARARSGCRRAPARRDAADRATAATTR